EWFRGRTAAAMEDIRRQFPHRYRDILRENLSREPVQIGAAFLLGEVGDPEIVPVIEPWLDAPERRTRELALQVLRRVESERVAEIAFGVIAESRDATLLEHALVAAATNWQPDESYEAIAQRIRNWPAPAR